MAIPKAILNEAANDDAADDENENDDEDADDNDNDKDDDDDDAYNGDIDDGEDNDSFNDDEQTHGIASFRRKLASLFVVASRTLFYSIAPG